MSLSPEVAAYLDKQRERRLAEGRRLDRMIARDEERGKTLRVIFWIGMAPWLAIAALTIYSAITFQI